MDRGHDEDSALLTTACRKQCAYGDHDEINVSADVVAALVRAGANIEYAMSHMEKNMDFGGHIGDAAKMYVLLNSVVAHWQPRHHTQHGADLRRAVKTVMLIFTRTDNGTTTGLPHLPAELWAAICANLRSSDFTCSDDLMRGVYLIWRDGSYQRQFTDTEEIKSYQRKFADTEEHVAVDLAERQAQVLKALNKSNPLHRQSQARALSCQAGSPKTQAEAFERAKARFDENAGNFICEIIPPYAFGCEKKEPEKKEKRRIDFSNGLQMLTKMELQASKKV